MRRGKTGLLRDRKETEPTRNRENPALSLHRKPGGGVQFVLLWLSILGFGPLSNGREKCIPRGWDTGPLAMQVNVLILQIKITTILQTITGIAVPGFSVRK